MCSHRKLSTKTHNNQQKRCIQNFAFYMWVGSLDQPSTVGDGSNLVAKMNSMVFSKRTVMPHHHHNLPALKESLCMSTLFLDATGNCRYLSSELSLRVERSRAWCFCQASLSQVSSIARIRRSQDTAVRSSRTISKPKTLTLLNWAVSSMPCTLGFVSFCGFLWILKLRLLPLISPIFEKREMMHCASCEVQFSCCSFSLWGGCCCSKDVRDLLGVAVLLLL